MDVKDKIIVVTGGADGIGKGLCHAFHDAGAQHIIVADLNGAQANEVAVSVNGTAFEVNVGREADVTQMIDATESTIGPIDLYVSNAGIFRSDPDPAQYASCSNQDWQDSWDVNVMAHVYAVRSVVPKMLARGGGAFLITASAAGLLSQIGSASYAVTKHAAVGLAESLAITHGRDGLHVYALCPEAVMTPLIHDTTDIAAKAASMDGVLTPEDVACATLQGLRDETFLILPHAQVKEHMAHKSQNYERWIGGMQKFRQSLLQG